MARRAALALARTPSARPALHRPAPGRGARSRIARLRRRARRPRLRRRARDVRLRLPDGQGHRCAAPVAARGPRRARAARGNEPRRARSARRGAAARSASRVASAHVDRAFPHRLTIEVEPERPLAVYRDGATAWLVAASGRVLAADASRRAARASAHRGSTSSRTPTVGDAAPGRRRRDRAAPCSRRCRAASRAASSTRPIDEDRRRRSSLADGPEIRLGEPTELAAKLAAAAAVCARCRRTNGSRWATWT